MRQRFQPRHIVAIVVAVCAAAILTPVAVGAATGTLVNIADPVDTTRVAKVTFNNGLQTEARAAANPANLIRAYKTGLNTGRGVVASFPTPYVAAITHVTYANFPTSTAPAHIELVGWTRISGTGTCESVLAGTTTGFVSAVLHRAWVAPGVTDTFNFDGPALITNAPAPGQLGCVIVDNFNPGTVSYDATVVGFLSRP